MPPKPRALRLSPCLVPLVALAIASGGASANATPGAKTRPIGKTGSGSDGSPPVCKSVTVKGRVFYNDLRRNGRFSLRRNPAGSTGRGERWVETPSPGGNANYLGLLDATVHLYEHDVLSHVGECRLTESVGETEIAGDGTFEWQGTICDSCTLDRDGAKDNGVSLVAEVRLESCDHPEGRCFSVRDPKGTGDQDHYADKWDGPVWSRWLRGADLDNPVGIHRETIVDLGDDQFQERPGLIAADVDDLEAQAANVFASMADVTRKVHLQSDVPFDHARWGEIKAYFPSVIGHPDGGAHSHQAGRLCVGAPHTSAVRTTDLEAAAASVEEWQSGPETRKYTGPSSTIVEYEGDDDYRPRHPEVWLDGGETAHEYGHLVHYWAWDGFGKWASFCYNDDCEESTTTEEYALTAFKEAWATFVEHVTYDSENDAADRCAGVENDDPLGCGGPALCRTGRHYIVDVKHALCDLWDAGNDSRIWGNVGFRDNVEIPLEAMRDVLAEVWKEASSSQRSEIEKAYSFGPSNTATAALGLCSFAQTIVDERTASLATVRSALAVNGIECELEE